MKWKTVIGVMIAFALGFGAAWVLRGPFQSPQTFVTKSDLDLGASYYFSDHPDGPPLQGTLKAGSELVVTFRKGGVHIRLGTVIDRDTFARITQPAEPAPRLAGVWSVDFASMDDPDTYGGVAYEFGEDGSFAMTEGEKRRVGTWESESHEGGRLRITIIVGGRTKKAVVEFEAADHIRMWHVDHPEAAFPLKRK